jgi:hypothetical protein
VKVLYAVVHRTAGALATFATPYEAGREMARILLEEPDWVDDLRLEAVEVVATNERSYGRGSK